MKGQTKVVEYIHRDENELMYYNYVKKIHRRISKTKNYSFPLSHTLGLDEKILLMKLMGKMTLFENLHASHCRTSCITKR